VSATKSLLRQIRDKESDLDRELEQAAQDARQIVEDAQKAAEGIIREAEREGSAAAGEHQRKSREQLDREIAALREQGRGDRAVTGERAGMRMPHAVGRIVDAVLLR
jgi:vacuolar-type H+-ATPase subunit H